MSHLVTGAVKELGRIDIWANIAGADILTSWYKRNLRMLANFHLSLDPGDTRALMLVGSGHNKILWDLIETSPLLCRIDAQSFLSAP